MNDQERAAIQQALEALEKSGCVAFKGLACRCNSTCASYTAAVALRAALAQEQPEHDPALSAALGWPGGISDPVLDRKTLLQQVAALAQEQSNGSWRDGVLEGQLRERERWLAQQPEPVQEPVGEMRLSEIIDGMVVPAVPAELPVGTKLYAAPQPQRPPLTDEEILRAAINACDSLHITRAIYAGGGRKTICDDAGLLEICRAIERKVRGE